MDGTREGDMDRAFSVAQRPLEKDLFLFLSNCVF